jgi:hypothetical protein
MMSKVPVIEVPYDATVEACPRCGALCFKLRLTNGETALVQGAIVRGLVPERELVATPGKRHSESDIQRCIEGGMTVGLGPPMFIVHDIVCNTAPLSRGLSPAALISKIQLGVDEPTSPDPEPPVEHERKPVVHDLEIQGGKLGHAAKIKDGSEPN